MMSHVLPPKKQCFKRQRDDFSFGKVYGNGCIWVSLGSTDSNSHLWRTMTKERNTWWNEHRRGSEPACESCPGDEGASSFLKAESSEGLSPPWFCHMACETRDTKETGDIMLSG
ncbi:hypothetical protein H1C71_024791 [Ictidomys tridecemlineatus]|nr:hypothetical protein H1C71_024791 [Ictidomys tridecemlineatus]